MILTVMAVGFCYLLGLAIGGGFKLYFSFKRFVSEVIEKSIPIELIEEVVEGITSPWKRWAAQKILLFCRSRYVDWIYRIVTAPDTIAGMAIKVGGFLMVGLVIGTICGLERYFGDVPVHYSLSGSAAGVLIGWFTLRLTVDRLVDYLILQITGLSTSSIRKGANYLGMEMRKAVVPIDDEPANAVVPALVVKIVDDVESSDCCSDDSD